MRGVILVGSRKKGKRTNRLLPGQLAVCASHKIRWLRFLSGVCPRYPRAQREIFPLRAAPASGISGGNSPHGPGYIFMSICSSARSIRPFLISSHFASPSGVFSCSVVKPLAARSSA